MQFWKLFVGEAGFLRNAKNFLSAVSGEARNDFVRVVVLQYINDTLGKAFCTAFSAAVVADGFAS